MADRIRPVTLRQMSLRDQGMGERFAAITLLPLVDRQGTRQMVQVGAPPTDHGDTVLTRDVPQWRRSDPLPITGTGGRHDVVGKPARDLRLVTDEPTTDADINPNTGQNAKAARIAEFPITPTERRLPIEISW